MGTNASSQSGGYRRKEPTFLLLFLPSLHPLHNTEISSKSRSPGSLEQSPSANRSTPSLDYAIHFPTPLDCNRIARTRHWHSIGSILLRPSGLCLQVSGEDRARRRIHLFCHRKRKTVRTLHERKLPLCFRSLSSRYCRTFSSQYKNFEADLGSIDSVRKKRTSQMA